MHNFENIVYSILLTSIFLIDVKSVIGAEGPEVKPSETAILNSTFLKPSTQRVAEGGKLTETIIQDQTHLSREHVTEKLNVPLSKELDSSKPNSDMPQTVNNSSVDNINAKPVKEDLEMKSGVAKKNDNSHSVGKKGVSPNDSITTHLPMITVTSSNKTNSETSTTIKTVTAKVPSKPLITEHDDVASVLSETKKNTSEVDTPKIPGIETQNNHADYVVPIVAVILSVPLVAIIISVLYKHGKDWWQHRNYRRMDFLIEGMYNS